MEPFYNERLLNQAQELGIQYAKSAMQACPDLAFDLDALDDGTHPDAFDEALELPGSASMDVADISAAVHEGIEYAYINADTEGL